MQLIELYISSSLWSAGYLALLVILNSLQYFTSVKFVKVGSKSEKSIKGKVIPLTFWTRLETTVWPQQWVSHSFIYCSRSVKTRFCSLFSFYQYCDHFLTHLSLWGKHGELYNKKCEKYHPLFLAMISNDWLMHLFPIEVGARGYCSKNVKSCLMWLGFSSNLVKSTFKSLSWTYLKASSQIWLCGDSKK